MTDWFRWMLTITVPAYVLVPAFLLGVIVAFQMNILKNSAQIRRNSETIRRNSEAAWKQRTSNY